MVRDMQKDQDADSMSITSESSFGGESEVDEEDYALKKKEDAKSRWRRIATKKPKVTDKNLHTNFIKNVKTFHSIMEKTKDLTAEDDEDDDQYMKRLKREANLPRFRNKSLKMMATLARDKSIREDQLKRQEQLEQLKKRKAQIAFKDAAHRVMPNMRNKMTNLVARMQLKKESEQIKSEELEIEMDRLGDDLDAELAGMGDETEVKETFGTDMRSSRRSSIEAEGGKSSSSTERSLKDEEFQIHIPKADSDDEWPDEDDYVNIQDTDRNSARL